MCIPRVTLENAGRFFGRDQQERIGCRSVTTRQRPRLRAASLTVMSGRERNLTADVDAVAAPGEVDARRAPLPDHRSVTARSSR